MKKCPYCAEEIQDEAILCKHCHSTLPVTGEGIHGLIAGSPNTTYSSVSVSARTIYTVISLLLNIIAAISLIIPFFAIPFGFTSSGIPVSPLFGIGNILLNKNLMDTLQTLDGNNPISVYMAIVIAVCIALFILSIVAIINAIRGIINWSDYSESLSFFRTSTIFIATINGIAIITTLINNHLIKSASYSFLEIPFPTITLIFAILSIAFAIAITKFFDAIYYAEKREKEAAYRSGYNGSSYNSGKVYVWTCKACGQENSSTSLYCLECGTHK